MLDFFTILSKGGFVLWCYTLQGVKVNVQESVNALIKNVILQERSGSAQFSHGSLTIKYKLDNEFELMFVVGYQKFLSLTYVDKLIDDVHKRFRDAHKQSLLSAQFSTLIRTEFDFAAMFKDLLKIAESQGDKPKTMQTFEQSAKSSKTVDSLKIDPNKKEEKTSKKKKNKKNKGNKNAEPVEPEPLVEEVTPTVTAETNGMDEIARNREIFRLKQLGQYKKPKAQAGTSPKPTKKGKTERKWGDKISKEEALQLNYSNAPVVNGNGSHVEDTKRFADDQTFAGTAVGEIKALEYEEEDGGTNETQSTGMFSMFKGLVGAKALTEESLKPVLDKMMDHLIGKNVAADIAEKLCQSVSAKLEGKVLGTFSSVTSTVRQCVQETLVQILTPKRRVDILRDVLDAQRNKKPYVITFCGVNGVGKSTNLAKVCFWLLENGFNVLVAACDTFRAGAVEQLRTHTVRLNTIHPSSTNVERVGLFEKGYGKDAANIAMQAITYASREAYDVVLVDTAGRMQDNEPLMRSLAKLIAVNQPDLVLFVGEALVGNEAVDQLTKFNQALADYSMMERPRLIDGIVLTKFDTIDDKVGAAISMTYTTGQPIVFVGTGQSYPDLRSLNAQTVVKALLV